MNAHRLIRRLLWTLVAIVTLVALFYAEENWRGACHWRSAQDAYARAGKSLDYGRFIPPPIPDEENLGALPLFTQEWAQAPRPGSAEQPSLRPVALEKAMHEDLALPALPRLGNYLDGTPADIEQVRRGVAALYATAFAERQLPASTLDQFDAVFPVVDQLRLASIDRPLCRFNVEYAPPPQGDIPLVLLTDQIPLAKLIALHAVLALNNHQPDVAINDLRTLSILASGAQRYPALLGHLCSIAIHAIGEAIVVEGLARHAWNDAQLAQLQEQLGEVDFLENFENAMQAETAFSISTFEFMKSRFSVGHTWKHLNPRANPGNRLLNPFSPWPVGWIEENEAQFLRFQLQLQATADPRRHRVYANRVQALAHGIDNDEGLAHFAWPWDLLFRPAVGPIRNATFKFARSAFYIDHTILACALERYRLAHATYPETLNELSPVYCRSIPRDLITGNPLRYRLLPGGSYLLYSVGANGVDDGGKLAYDPQKPGSIDFDRGDWVWFGPK